MHSHPNRTSILALISIFILLASNYTQAGPPPGAGAWTLTLADEFNGTSLNTAVWTKGYRWSEIINNELQGMRPENVTVANGLCTIKVEKRTVPNCDMYGYQWGSNTYASGALTTYNKWTKTYGYFEARVRMPGGKGTWPAFWLLPDRGPSVTPLDNRVGVGTRGGAVAMGNEIDIFEYMGTWKNPTTGLSKSHCGYFWDYNGGSIGKYVWSGKLASPDTQFHTYGLYWAPGTLTYYIDGNALFASNRAEVASCPEYILLNCAVSTNDWTGTPVPTANIDASLPCTMDIDYVRVYSGTAPGNDSGDIGAVGLAGSDSVSASGVHTLTASGDDIGGTADAFHFTGHAMTGDCSLTARVDSLTNTNNLAKAGVMMRQQIDDPASPHAFMPISAFAPASFQYRSATGGSTSAIGGQVLMVDDGFTDGARSNGADLQDTQWYTMSGTPNVSVVDDSAGLGFGNALELIPTAGQRGIVGLIPSRTLLDGDSITLTFNWRFTGTANLNQARNLRFGLQNSRSTPVTADSTAESDNDAGYFVGTNPGATGSNTNLNRENGNSPSAMSGTDWAVFGSSGGSSYAGVTPHTARLTLKRVGTTLQASASIDNLAAATGADASPYTWTFDQFAVSLSGTNLPSPIRIDNVQVAFGNTNPVQPPNWVRLTRTGNIFAGYTSNDGTNWAAIGSQTIPMNNTIYLGLAATSHNNSALTTAAFSNIQLNPALLGKDIGAVGVSGNYSVSSGVYTIQGGGAELGGTADACYFVGQSLAGDGSITARINSIVRTDYAAKAAVMMRVDGPDTYTPGAVNACVIIPNLSHIDFNYRATSGGATTSVRTSYTSYHPVQWARLTRVGNLFTGYFSPDGVNWTLIGSQTIAMPATLKVGLGVCSHNVTTLTTAVIDNLTITGAGGL